MYRAVTETSTINTVDLWTAEHLVEMARTEGQRASVEVFCEAHGCWAVSFDGICHLCYAEWQEDQREDSALEPPF